MFEGLRGVAVVGREKRKSWRGLGPSMVLKLFREGHRIWKPSARDGTDVPSTSLKGFEGGALADGKVAPCANGLGHGSQVISVNGLCHLSLHHHRRTLARTSLFMEIDAL